MIEKKTIRIEIATALKLLKRMLFSLTIPIVLLLVSNNAESIPSENTSSPELFILPMGLPEKGFLSDGISTYEIRFLAISDDGEIVSRLPESSVSKGDILSMRRDEDGWISVIYRPPRIDLKEKTLLNLKFALDNRTIEKSMELVLLPPHRGRVIPVEVPSSITIIDRNTFSISLIVEGNGGVTYAGRLPLHIVQSEGEVIKEEWKDGGRLHLSFKLSPDKKPRYWSAVIGIKNDDSVMPAFLSIPVYGIPDLKIKTEPGALVEIEVGGKIYGPYTSPEDGTLKPNILMGPSFKEINILAKDRAGNRSRVRMERGYPIVFNPILYSPFQEVYPSKDREISVYIYLPQDQGIGVDNIKAETESGGTCGIIRIKEGLYKAICTIPAKKQTSDLIYFTILHRIAGEVKKGIPLIFRNGPPYRLLIDTTSDRLTPESPKVNLDILVLDRRGEGISNQSLQIDVDSGIVTPIREIGRGLYRTEVTGVFEKGEEGVLKRKEIEGKVTVYFNPPGHGLPSTLKLWMEKGVIFSGEVIDLYATILDRAGYPVSGVEVSFAQEKGTGVIDPSCTTDIKGRCSVRYSSSSDLSTPEITSIMARVEGCSNVASRTNLMILPLRMKKGIGHGFYNPQKEDSPFLQGSFSLHLMPGRVKDVSVKVDPPVIDGIEGGGAELQIILKDSFGNRVTNRKLLIRASKGTVEKIREKEGRYFAIYRPPSRFCGDATITITSPEGDFATSANISVIRPEKKYIGSLMGGYITNFSSLYGPFLDLFAGFRLKKGAESLLLRGGCGYIFYKGSGIFSETHPFNMRFHLLPLTLGLNYNFKYRTIAPYTGTSIALFLMFERITGGRVEDIDYYELEPGYSLYGGISIPLGIGNLFFETGYLSSFSFEEDTEPFGIDGIAGGVYLTSGYRIGI